MQNKEFKRHIAYEVLTILGTLALLLFVCRLWPILLLVILGIFIAAMRLLFLSARKVENIPPLLPAARPEPTDQDIRDMAFGSMQRRITELVTADFPNARWVWKTPNAMHNIATGNEVRILLNHAGGYREAIVVIRGLQVCSLTYPHAEEVKMPETENDETGAEENEDDTPQKVDPPENYEYLAFEWVDAHVMELNERCNESIAQGLSMLEITAAELPARESWPDICRELERNGMENCCCTDTGITIADIVLDMVIMAPEMIRPLDDLRSMRKRVNVFLVMEDWAVNGEHGNDCEAFSDYDDAKRVMTNRIREELEDGSVPSWRESSIFAENSSMDFYEAYLDGEYMENHYKIMIIRQPLMMSSRYIREVGGVYKAQCQTEDFISQIEQWDEVAALSDAQYQRLITNPMIPECIERHLGRNDHYWEAYWESVSEAAHGLVRQASKQPDCFTPEAENPYPLCIGSGKSECDDCCLYMHMKGEGGYEC